MSFKYFLRIVATLVLLVSGASVYAQEVTGGGVPDTGEIEILHADNLFYERVGEDYVHRMIGQVRLLHDSTFLLCDSAIMKGRKVDALGNVTIIQGDSTRVYADTLLYDGTTHQSDLYGQVVLHDKERELFTSQLHYDLKEKIGVYQHSAVLTDGSTYLRSKTGRYYVNSEYVYFNDSVTVLDTSFVLRADSLLYSTGEQRAYFISPTVIDTDSSSIYCERGWFDFNSRDALFAGNADYRKGDQIANADTIFYLHDQGLITLRNEAIVVEPGKRATAAWIQYNQRTKDIAMRGDAHYSEPGKIVDAQEIYYNSETKKLRTVGDSKVMDGSREIVAQQMDYDEETGMGRAEGHVVIIDTSDHFELHCDRVLHDKETGFLKATGTRPWMVQHTGEDSLYIAADTILSFRISETDTTRILKAWYNVQMFKEDFQGICDSLIWYEKDSSFKLLQEPVLWSDTSQFVADTILIYMKNKTVDRVDQRKHAFIITTEDEVLFNQLKGRNITTTFLDKEPYQSHIVGNAEVVYYIVDDHGDYVAANKTECSEMKIRFVDQKVDKIRFYKQPKGQMLPLEDPKATKLKLEGFRWITSERPASFEEIIHWKKGQ